MKYLLIVYVAAVTLFLTFKPAPASKGPECGAGVLCIRTQKQVQALFLPSTRDLTRR